MFFLSSKLKIISADCVKVREALGPDRHDLRELTLLNICPLFT